MANPISFISENLELRDNNPYSICSLFVFEEGDYLLDRKQIVVEKSPKDRYYTVTKGDTLGMVAFYAYGNSKLWWILDDVNNLNLTSFQAMVEPITLTTLYIPDLDKIKTTIID